jgi:predicted secreted Zn-dependent protease
MLLAKAEPMPWKLLPTAFVLVNLTLPAAAASLSKTYSYFTIGGKTLEEIESNLVRRGPHVNSTGMRHPGATQMEFTTKIGYGQTSNRCIVNATVSVKARMILPRWRQQGRVDRGVKFIWGTLSDDIRRHEETHVMIAKNHGRELEQALNSIGRMRTCQMAAARAKDVTQRVLAKHDRAQQEFDRAESVNFERRIVRLLRYRLERISAGQVD